MSGIAPSSVPASVPGTMAAQWQAIVGLLIERGALSKSARSMLCPDRSDQIVSRLLQEGAMPELLIGVFADVLNLPLYSEEEHGLASKSGDNWVYANRILFVTDPYWSGCLHPEQLIGEALFKNMRERGLGLLHIPDTDESNRSKASVQSEKIVTDWLIDASSKDFSDLLFTPHNEHSARLYGSEHGTRVLILEYPLIPVDGRPPFALLANTILRLSGHRAGVWLKPEDGKINIKLDSGKRINVRIAMRPVELLGERWPLIAARILSSDQALRPLGGLGIPKPVLTRLRNITRRSSGLILVAGPTNSGKTTTLYSMLQDIQEVDPWRSIQTAEDPIEINLAGIDQSPIQESVGMTYPAVIRSFLRTNPDVLLIGEIRDHETAQMVITLALTGHLIMASIHTKTALAAIERLLDLGVTPYLLASTLSAVYAQRLVRKVCSHCSTSTEFNSNFEWHQRYGKSFRPTGDDDFRLANAGGCEHCQSGYTGRMIVVELGYIDSPTAKLIADGAPLQEIEDLRRECGMEFLWDHAIELCRQGMTTIPECERVLSPRTNYGRHFEDGLEDDRS